MKIDVEILAEDEHGANIAALYWELDEFGAFSHKIASIARKFGTTSNKVSSIVKEFSRGLSGEIICTDCSIPYIFTSRADYLSKKNNEAQWACPECVQRQVDELSERKRLEVVHVANSCLQNKFNIDMLDFKSSIYVLAVVRFLASEDLDYLRSYSSNQAASLSPNREFDMNVLRELTNNNILVVSPSSNPDCIVLDDENGFRYHLDQVEWLMPVDLERYNSPAMFIQELEDKLRSMEWEEKWYDEAQELCSEVALQESLSYLRLVMSEHQFDFVPGEKTILVLSKVLNKYSVAQAYNLIWAAGKDAAAYYLRGGIMPFKVII